MALANNHVKEISVYRCPHCRQISHDYEWVFQKEKENYQCPKCRILCSTPQLKPIHVELLKRGRIWVDFGECHK